MTASKITMSSQAPNSDQARDLRILRAILDDSATQSERKQIVTRAVKTNEKPAANKQASAKPRRVNLDSQRNIKVNGTVEQTISLREQRQIATKTFNSNLKILSAFVKKRQDNRRVKSVTAQVQSLTPEVHQVAEAACLALDVLRKTDATDPGLAQTELSPYEHGTLLLIDKLIFLEFEDLSLRQLHAFVDQYWHLRKPPESAENPVQSSYGDALPKLLLWTRPILHKDALDTACTFQLQLLRLVLISHSHFSTDLASACDVSVSGTPANIVTKGLESGLMDENRASLQYDILSQTMLRLAKYASSDRSISIQMRLAAFELALHACNIKLLAHKLIASTSRINEAWEMLGFTLRIYWIDEVTADAAVYPKVRDTVEKIQGLTPKGQNLPAPSILLTFLSTLAEANADVTNALIYLQGLALSPDVRIATLGTCRSITLKLRSRIPCLEEYRSLCQTLSDPDNAFTISGIDDVIDLIRLRKSSFQVAKDFLDAEKTFEAEEPLLQLSLRMLTTLAQLFNELAARKQTKDQKVRQALKSAYLKSVESTLSLETNKIDFEKGYGLKFAASVKECSDLMLKSAPIDIAGKNDPVYRSSLLHMLTRLSNTLWRMFSNHTASDLTAAIASIKLLDLLPAELQQQNSLGQRQEQLARHLVTCDRKTEARDLLVRAISLYISCGALRDVIEIGFQRSRNHFWNGDSSLARQLGRSLISHDKVANTLSVSWAYFDDTSLPETHRAVLLEFQFLQHLRLNVPSNEEELLTNVQLILNLAQGKAYHIWRIRFACSVIYHLLQNKRENSHILSLLLTALNSESDNVSNDYPTVLFQQGPSLQLLLYSQALMIGQTKDLQLLSSYLDAVRDQLVSVPSDQDLDRITDDQQMFANILLALSQWLSVRNHYRMVVSTLQILLLTTNKRNDNTAVNIVQLSAKISDCFIRLGDLTAAAQVLQVLTSEEHEASDPRIRLIHEMAIANLCLATSDVPQCVSALRAASLSASQVWISSTSISAKAQMAKDVMTANATLIACQLSQRSEDLETAYTYARQACKIALSVWASVQRRQGETGCWAVRQDFQHQGLVTSSSLTTWECFDLLNNAIRISAQLYLHAGMYEDAIYCLKKLSSAHRRVKSEMYDFSDLTLRMVETKGNISASQTLAILNKQSIPNTPETMAEIDAFLDMCEILLIDGQYEVCSSLLKNFPSISAEIPVSQYRCAPKPAKTKKNVVDNDILELTASLSKVGFSTLPHSTLTIFARQIESRKYGLLHRYQHHTGYRLPTSELEKVVGSFEKLPAFLVEEMFSLAMVTLEEVEQDLAEHPEHAILTDSAVAVPAKVTNAHSTRHVSLLQGTKDLSKSRSIPEESGKADSNAQDFLLRLNLVARMVKLLFDRASHCTTEILHMITTMHTRISLFLITLNRPLTYASDDLIIAACQSRDTALSREMKMARSEVRTKSREQLSVWPDVSISKTKECGVSAGDLNELPSCWTIVSMRLANNAKELLLSKIVKGQSPFLLRIPLMRANEEEADEVLTFEAAESQMRQITSLANDSSHDLRSTGDKSKRLAWHADRQALDRRLEILLCNIERLWLGGFRGVFSPTTRTTAQLQTFRSSLHKALDSHLPSRRRGNRTMSSRLELHDQILELFLGLCHTSREDFEDDLLDLLYFVVDILQINNERNAYDEIDWDALTVDVMDALQPFHKHSQSTAERQVILILDSSLENIPWESLPCLQECSVSRMPSLESIMERVRTMSAEAKKVGALCLVGAQVNGAYILNPSGDLTSTQAVIEPILSKSAITSSFRATVETVPTEDDFKNHLNTDILLYFGHGSGAQYIRPRTIRSLDHCATTFLFGCSSLKMTSHGVYESTGMPRSYILGCAPAVVGCLWDVTDREIDRVALRTLAEWGLLDASDAAVQKGLEIKGKRRKPSEKSEERKNLPVSRKNLSEAVMNGRKACDLRYLCGAAVVVYGVPIVLTD